MSKAHDFPDVYKDLGYNLGKLGCIMLDTEPLADIAEYITDKAYLYYAKDKTKFWVDGVVCDKTPHVTLLYGLLRSGLEMKKHVDTVLGDLPQVVEVDRFGYFESPYEDEPYYCIVAHLKLTDELVDANERLKFLPHINTFPGYKAHLTLGYIKKDPKTLVWLLQGLTSNFSNTLIRTTSLNYGGDK
jgi:hypothetical protein